MNSNIEPEMDAVIERIRKLMPSQRRALSLFTKGLYPEQVAERLFVKPASVQAMQSNILSDLELSPSIPYAERLRIARKAYVAYAERLPEEAAADARSLETLQPYKYTRRSLELIQKDKSKKHSTAKPISMTEFREASQLTNGHAPEAKAPEKSKPVEESIQPTGVYASTTLANPESIVDVVDITLGTDESAQKLQELLQKGYLPEIVDDFQSMTDITFHVTRLILTKRR